MDNIYDMDVINRTKNISLTRRIIFSIILILFSIITIVFIYIILSNGMGYYKEGKIGFFSEIVFRLFTTFVILIIFAFSHFIKEKWQATVAWWICLIIACFGLFHFLKAPILDLKYINSPISEKLKYITIEEDNNYEYITVYRITGYNEKDEMKIFQINSKTYDNEKEKCKGAENVLANVKYLPNTNVLMNLEIFKENEK